MDKKIAQIIYFVGILSKIEATESTFYLDLCKGAKISTPAGTISYDAFVPKHVRAMLIGNDDKTTGKFNNKPNYGNFKVTPGKFREYYELSAEDAAYIKAGELAYFDGKERSAADAIYGNVATYIKNSITSRMDLAVAEILSNGRYRADTGEVIKFDIPEIKTRKKNDVQDFRSFLRIIKEEIGDYKRSSLDSPDKILIGEDVVNDLIDDEFFMKQVDILGLANVMHDDKHAAIAKVFNYLLTESEPILDINGGNVDIAKGNRITMLATKRIHKANAGVDVLDSQKMPKKIAAEFIMRNASDDINATSIFVGESAFTPIISNVKSVVRIEITK